MNIEEHENLLIKQVREGFELLGIETRNKYQILDIDGNLVCYAAEERKNIFDFFFRQILGHWRRFDIKFFTESREEYLLAHHPFKFVFQRLVVRKPNGEPVGSLQQRFSVFYKEFDLENSRGEIIAEMKAARWRLWTFPILRRGQELARISKKWSGFLSEVFTDRDNFVVNFSSENLSEAERQLILASAIFIDLQYFENRARD